MLARATLTAHARVLAHATLTAHARVLAHATLTAHARVLARISSAVANYSSCLRAQRELPASVRGTQLALCISSSSLRVQLDHSRDVQPNGPPRARPRRATDVPSGGALPRGRPAVVWTEGATHRAPSRSPGPAPIPTGRDEQPARLHGLEHPANSPSPSTPHGHYEWHDPRNGHEPRTACHHAFSVVHRADGRATGGGASPPAARPQCHDRPRTSHRGAPVAPPTPHPSPPPILLARYCLRPWEPLPLQPNPVSTAATLPPWVYQPPTATPLQLLALQSSLAPQPDHSSPQMAPPSTPALPQPGPSSTPALPQLAPFSGSVPAIPPWFAKAAASGEYVDFNELLKCLEHEGGEEPPVCLQLGEDNRLSLPRKPKKRPITTFPEWARCYAVYAHHLASHQPMRAPDLMAYLYNIATCHGEYHFHPCMAYDVAFRMKASRFKLTSWGHIDPQLYTRAFTGPGKARPRAWCDHCLTSSHTSPECPLFSLGGPAKRARVAPAGPRQAMRTQPRDICCNYNRGRCSQDGCHRLHECLTPGCRGLHPNTSCPARRASPRKP